MFKLIIYDFDGTVADTFALHLKAYAFSLSHFEIRVSNPEIVDKCFNKTDEEAARNFGIKDTDSFSEYYRRELDRLSHHVDLYPNIIPTLEELKNKKLRLGIGTARYRHEIEPTLDSLDLRKYFDVILTHDEVERKKPDPEIFLRICSQLQIDVSDVLVVGDSEKDLTAANNMPAKTALFYPEKHKDFYNLEELKKLEPTYIIKDHLEILNKVLM